MRTLREVCFFFLFCVSLYAQTGFSLQTVASLSNQATSFAVLPDGRILVCERLTGNVREIVGGSLTSWAWWNTGYTYTPTNESGLLGIAVDPQFVSNGYVYVCYTDAPNSLTKIVRLTESGGVGTSPTTIHSRSMTATVHQSGPLVFGPDGYLYARTGDSNSGQSQTWSDPRGKILRMDTSGSAPSGNPTSGVVTWASGLRNGYGLAFHPTQGWLYDTENGFAGGDEVNLITAGSNYGWPTGEGYLSTSGLTDPIHFWPLSGGAWVPTGCAVVAPETVRWSNYVGDLFVAQWSGTVHRFVIDDNGAIVSGPTSWWTHRPTFALSNGPDGNLWVLCEDNFGFAWTVNRYRDTAVSLPGANVGPVSGPSIGGSVTVGLSTSVSNGYMLCWCSINTYSPPISSPYGPIEVPSDYLFAGAFADGNKNVFHVLTIPNNPSLVGTPINVQGMDYDLVTGAGTVTNKATHLLR